MLHNVVAARRTAMSDDKKDRGEPDRRRVSLIEDYEALVGLLRHLAFKGIRQDQVE
jgi:hypothetical protein